MKQTVLRFWFEEASPAQWFKKDPAFDELIRDKFTHLHRQASRCELYEWRESAKGRLAEIIILDQFSRNMYRESSRAFACDSLALALAQEAVAGGTDQELSNTEKSFLYLPFMHSESLVIHNKAEELYRQAGLESNYEWEVKHKSIIERFGRYPHRNKVLGRKSTAEELEFLQSPGSSF